MAARKSTPKKPAAKKAAAKKAAPRKRAPRVTIHALEPEQKINLDMPVPSKSLGFEIGVNRAPEKPRKMDFSWQIVGCAEDISRAMRLNAVAMETLTTILQRLQD